MIPELIIACVLVVISIGLDVWALNTFVKADKIKQDAEFDLGDLRSQLAQRMDQIIDLKNELREKDNEIKALKHDIPLFREPCNLSLKRDKSKYIICACFKTKTSSEILLPIKSFPFGDDKEFALLETRELLDHLNEK